MFLSQKDNLMDSIAGFEARYFGDTVVLITTIFAKTNLETYLFSWAFYLNMHFSVEACLFLIE